MRKLTTLGLFLVAASLAAPLAAKADNDQLQCTNADQSAWMSEKAITDSLLALGYAEVRKIKVSDGGCYEAYVIASSGDKKELFLDPITGNVVGED